MSTPEQILTSLAEGNAVAEVALLRKTLHKGAMRGSETLSVRTDLKAIANEYVPAKGVGKQDPPREVGTISTEEMQKIAKLFLAMGVHLPPGADPAPGGAEVEFGVTIGDQRVSLRKPSYAVNGDPNWSAASIFFDDLRKKLIPQ